MAGEKGEGAAHPGEAFPVKPAQRSIVLDN